MHELNSRTFLDFLIALTGYTRVALRALVRRLPVALDGAGRAIDDPMIHAVRTALRS
jgi:hypothetical protein